MGKPRLNAETKRARGTLRPCRESGKQPDVAPLEQIPPAPDSLGTGGRALWQNLGARLVTAGILTGADLPAFQLLCESRDRSDDLKSNLTHGGKILFSDAVADKENAPLYRAFKFEMDFAKKMLAEFGATPRARNTVAANPKAELSAADIRMMQLLNGEM